LKKQGVQITVNFDEFRNSDSASSWQLPPWSHPISSFALPLFMSIDDLLTPIGTAFIISKRLILALTAEHNVREILKKHPKTNKLALQDEISGSHSLPDNYILWLLHQHSDAKGDLTLTLWPLEHAGGPQPSDIIFVTPKAAAALPTLTPKISFEIPQPGTLVRCLGYTNFSFPDGGISLDSVRNGLFDWGSQYSHELWVVQGKVQQFFNRKFSSGYLHSPCFSIDAELLHGQSGGPAFNENGEVCGVNSASATNFYDFDSSLISPLYTAILTEVKFTFQLPGVTFNFGKTILGLIAQNCIDSGGSERMIHFSADPKSDKPVIGPLIKKTSTPAWIFDDFASYQQGRPAETVTDPVMKIKWTNSGSKTR
jgi:hypothetical protein